jgi:sentrin-specific protease 8
MKIPQDALPDFTNVSHIFLPINDNHSASIAEGGTHWSLLLVSIVDGVAFHYDSMPPGNQNEAHHVTQKLSKLINKPLRFINLHDSPLQDNMSDCGVFVCLNMRHLLLKRLLMVRTDSKVSMSLGGRAVDAAAGRKEMLKIIDEFRREGERRRSVSNSPHPGRKSRSPPRIDSPGANRSKSPRHG